MMFFTGLVVGFLIAVGLLALASERPRRHKAPNPDRHEFYRKIYSRDRVILGRDG